MGEYQLTNEKTASQKILFISSRSFFPPIGGDKLKNYNLLKLLFRNFKVYLVLITNVNPSAKEMEFYENHTALTKVFRKSAWKSYVNVILNIAGRYPMQVDYYYFKDVQKYIDQLAVNMDILYPALIRTARYTENIQKPKFLEMADSIALNYRESKDRVKSWFWKSIYNYEETKLFEYEKSLLKKYNATIYVNPNEELYWSRFGNTECIPNGVNDELLQRPVYMGKTEDWIGYFGKMNYQPNVDAVLWFDENCLNRLDSKMKLLVVGSEPDPQILALAKREPRVVVTGYQKDPYQMLERCLVVVAPMQTGGGMQNKILECMALGKIVITTTKVVKSIRGLKNQENIFEANTGEEYAKYITLIRKRPAAYLGIGKKAKRFIEKNYRWDIYEKKLKKLMGI